MVSPRAADVGFPTDHARVLRPFFLAAHVQDPQHEIYKSVVGGTIRAKYRGRILAKEEAASLADIRWDENSPYALPPEIQLSVEDALMVFDLARYRFGDNPATP